MSRVGHALVTGGAGFIGSHLVEQLLDEGWRVTVVDSFDDFYPRAEKEANLAAVIAHAAFRLVEADIRDADALRKAVTQRPDVIVHFAARAGVRPSIQRPLEYQDVNVRGTHELLELAREWGVKQFVFASSSSVYGVNPNLPWREDDAVLLPISPYASTKVSAELLGHVYSRLFGIRFVALRFFTVYGPRQRPDLAIRRFMEAIDAGRSIPVFGDGSTRRDYTYVGDVVRGVRVAMDFDAAPFEVINLGSHHAITLTEMIAAVERTVGKSARIERLPEQPGDVPQTFASVEKSRRLLGFAPATPFADGLDAMWRWLRR